MNSQLHVAFALVDARARQDRDTHQTREAERARKAARHARRRSAR